jgi:hypothetical protein
MSRSSPHVYCGGRLVCRGRAHIRGAGMGSVVLNKGGPGVGSSYSSMEDYKQTMSNSAGSLGGSLGAGLSDKLQKLMVKPLERKPHNIRF